MRDNVAVVFAAWTAGEGKGGNSISTDGVRIFSYQTCLVEREAGGRVLMNRSKYSKTTSAQQTAIHARIPYALILCGIPRGCKSLAEYAVEPGSNQGAQDLLNMARDPVESKYLAGLVRSMSRGI